MLLFNDQRRRQRMKMEARIIRIIGLLAILSMVIVVYLNIDTVVETQNESATERKLKAAYSESWQKKGWEESWRSLSTTEREQMKQDLIVWNKSRMHRMPADYLRLQLDYMGKWQQDFWQLYFKLEEINWQNHYAAASVELREMMLTHFESRVEEMKVIDATLPTSASKDFSQLYNNKMRESDWKVHYAAASVKLREMMLSHFESREEEMKVIDAKLKIV